MQFLSKVGLLTAVILVSAVTLSAASMVVAVPESMPAELPMVLGGLGLWIWHKRKLKQS